ncbi:hypothetical protein KQI84_13225 [bacterium]|nr:hypothetical protein [bacterium]
MTDQQNEPQFPQWRPEDLYWLQALQQIFSYDVLHIRQKVLAIAQKYYVTDEWNQPRFFVVRPPRLAINIALNLAVGIVRLAILFYVFRMIMHGTNPAIAIGILIVTNFILAVAQVLMAPYRDIEVFTGESQSWRILTITQDNKLGFWRRYSLYDCMGNEVATFRRNTFKSILRREWLIETPDGQRIMRVREDSLWLALLRRRLGPLWGALRTNFNFEFPDGTVFGKYDRKLTITDQYVLDLRGDPMRFIDRRVTAAMSILLDTGEMR